MTTYEINYKKNEMALTEKIKAIYKGDIIDLDETFKVENLATGDSYEFYKHELGTEDGDSGILISLDRIAKLVGAYGLYVNTERGNFSFNLRNYLDKTVFELNATELVQLIEDGFIRHINDIIWLEKYLNTYLNFHIEKIKLM